MPIRTRRLLLTLRYLQYVLQLDPGHYAHAAWLSSRELNRKGKKSWAKDLLRAIGKLPFDCPPLDLDNATYDSVGDYVKKIERLQKQWMLKEIDDSDKLYLLHDRKEPMKDKRPARVAMLLRHYLTEVPERKHRRALTSILLSTHLLALERLRWSDHEHPPVERSKRLCRFCKAEVESPEHALLQCEANPDLVALRETFMRELTRIAPALSASLHDVL